jgi:hypothetical protein
MEILTVVALVIVSVMQPTVAQGPKPNLPPRCEPCIADTGHHVGGPFSEIKCN